MPKPQFIFLRFDRSASGDAESLENILPTPPFQTLGVNVLQVTHFTCAGNNITLEGLETWEGGGLLIDEERGEQLLLSSES